MLVGPDAVSLHKGECSREQASRQIRYTVANDPGDVAGHAQKSPGRTGALTVDQDFQYFATTGELKL